MSRAGVRAAFVEALAARGFRPDPAQLDGIAALERCENAWIDYKARRGGALARMVRRPPLPRGVYLHGGVGRGKSFLMDCFFRSVPLQRKTRLHFHEFMREVHRELLELKGIADPLDELGRRIGRRHRLICFDEFHVADVTDAMILHRLLQAMFDNRVGIVTTSNFLPDDLYPNGLHRDRILPAIELLKAHLDVVSVDGGTDYRRLAMAGQPVFFTPLGPAADAAMAAAFERVADHADEDPRLAIEHRELVAKRRAGSAVWFDFRTLCGGPRSQNDYLEIAQQFRTVLLSDVPVMTPNLASEARRFTLLVDVLYDRHCQLVMSAAVPAAQLYVEGPLAHEFPRTVSRLDEMAGEAWREGARRDVDTRLT